MVDGYRYSRFKLPALSKITSPRFSKSKLCWTAGSSKYPSPYASLEVSRSSRISSACILVDISWRLLGFDTRHKHSSARAFCEGLVSIVTPTLQAARFLRETV